MAAGFIDKLRLSKLTRVTMSKLPITALYLNVGQFYPARFTEKNSTPQSAQYS